MTRRAQVVTGLVVEVVDRIFEKFPWNRFRPRRRRCGPVKSARGAFLHLTHIVVRGIGIARSDGDGVDGEPRAPRGGRLRDEDREDPGDITLLATDVKTRAHRLGLGGSGR